MHCGMHFYCHFMLMTLYKDCYAVGQNQLYEEVKMWILCLLRSLHHNVHKWAQLVVTLGNLTTWCYLAAELNLAGTVKGACLWMDSFDVPLSGVSKMSKKDPLWSYKLNSPSQRFMALLDACGQFCMLWGGYSQKDLQGVQLYFTLYGRLGPPSYGSAQACGEETHSL
ncbi:uncharacterized protein ACA1_075850 [Acanthamoeba castellanii str. Neff]|uniref:Uncharacterized protein n=1 Tax=Acanthamoeba castellanii (strain ATCC 30010 / Neff) TaxID=1257118 RepID=L8GNE0_ACACF|nr:uncharacterized protein ACA1_075850 [Acanthamoeba castellanii str. Neff]ELR13736.1 hypothetical protein ACA1_075850 [Acanthamoeba castellanii str. Neff]